METLNLASYGVEEMNVNEMVNENGGGAISNFIKKAIAFECGMVIFYCNVVSEVCEGVIEGLNEC